MGDCLVNSNRLWGIKSQSGAQIENLTDLDKMVQFIATFSDSI
jgi:hypothetical protein